MEINVPGGSYHVYAKTEFFPSTNLEPQTTGPLLRFREVQGGSARQRKRSRRSSLNSLEKSLKTGKQSRYRGNVTLELSLEFYHFLQCADSIRTNNELIMRGGIISKRQPSL
jgi:hypothetical protein